MTPEAELKKIQTENFAGGTYYGRTPNGIVDLRTKAMVPNSGSSSTTGTPTGNPIADSGIRRHVGVTPDTAGTYRGAADKFFSSLDITPPDATDEQSIKDKMRRDVQAQLDSIDALTATKLADEAVRATGRLGQGRSINARSGLLGSDMGEQRNASIEEVNKGARDAIIAEQAAAKATILDKANDRAYQQIQMETTKALTNAGNYLTWMKQKQEEARADVATLAASGISLDTLSDQEYSTLLNQSGYGSSFLFDAVYNSKMPANQKKEYNYINAGNGVIVRVDPTGREQPQNYNFSVPDGYQFKMAGDIPVFVNEKTQDVKIAAPGGDLAGAAGYAKETELDTYTNAQGKRVSVMYNPISKTTRSIVLGTAKDTDGSSGGFPTGFKPQPFEVSAVSQFITAEGQKQGQTPQQIQQALSLAQSNSAFFYSMLSTVVGDKTYSSLYYKPTTIGIPASYVTDMSPTPAGN